MGIYDEQLTLTTHTRVCTQASSMYSNTAARLEAERINSWNLAIIACGHRLQQIRKTKREHRWWVHAILQGRREHGTYAHLVQELALDSAKFHQYFRMSKDQFGHVLGLVEERLTKRCLSREVISARQRLAICLR